MPAVFPEHTCLPIASPRRPRGAGDVIIPMARMSKQRHRAVVAGRKPRAPLLRSGQRPHRPVGRERMRAV